MKMHWFYSFNEHIFIACFCAAVVLAGKDVCLDSSIGELHNGCMKTFDLSERFHHGVPVVLLEQDIDTLCSNLHNITSCLETNVDDCDSLYHDVSVYNNTFVKICSHKSLMLRAQLKCDVDEVFQRCLKLFQLEVVTLQHFYKPKSVPTLAMCRAYSKAGSCIQVAETSTCTKEMSGFLTDLYSGRFSPSVCTHLLAADTSAPVSRAASVGFTVTVALTLSVISMCSTCILLFSVAR